MKKLRANIVLGTLIEVIAGIIMITAVANNQEITNCTTFCFIMGMILSVYNIFDLGYSNTETETQVLLIGEFRGRGYVRRNAGSLLFTNISRDKNRKYI